MRKTVIIILIIMLSGCASSANFGQMIAQPPALQTLQDKKLVQNIAVVEVTGGKETNPLWTSQISNSGFETALIESLKNANLYQTSDAAPYRLTANLLKLHQPIIGYDFTVTCEVNYVLQDRRNQAVIYNQNIASSYTAKVSDSVIGVLRLKMATEGAARVNIRKFIEALYQLPNRNN